MVIGQLLWENQDSFPEPRRFRKAYPLSI